MGTFLLFLISLGIVFLSEHATAQLFTHFDLSGGHKGEKAGTPAGKLSPDIHLRTGKPRSSTRGGPGRSTRRRTTLGVPTPQPEPSIGSRKPEIPDAFTHLPNTILTHDALVYCDYKKQTCFYKGTDADAKWTLKVAHGARRRINGTGQIKSPYPFKVVTLYSDPLKGTKCVYFTVMTNSDDINFAMVLQTPKRETLTSFKGNEFVAQKSTVGIGSAKPYKIAFHLYAYTGHGRPADGRGYIGRIAVIDGPCHGERERLTCTFDYGLCDWIVHNGKYLWYPVPFSVHSSIPHKIQYGALAAFAGKGGLWSPLVEPVEARCFSFVYVRGEVETSYLRVWMLYTIPGMHDVKVLLYEDSSKVPVFKKEIHINIFVPWKFQIAYEGKSKNLIHGVVVLHTHMSTDCCEGTGQSISIEKRTTVQQGTFPTTPINPKFTSQTSTASTTKLAPL